MNYSKGRWRNYRISVYPQPSTCSVEEDSLRLSQKLRAAHDWSTQSEKHRLTVADWDCPDTAAASFVDGRDNADRKLLEMDW